MPKKEKRPQKKVPKGSLGSGLAERAAEAKRKRKSKIERALEKSGA